MKIAGIRELRAQSATLLGGDEPVLVTKHGKVSGVYLPLEDPDKLKRVLGQNWRTLAGNCESDIYSPKVGKCLPIVEPPFSVACFTYFRALK